MAKRQQKRSNVPQVQLVAERRGGPADSGDSRQPAVVEVPQQAPESAALPSVSLCTVTYNRSQFLPLLQRHILAQTYPRHRMEWVLVDDSDDGKPEFQPDQTQGLKIVHRRLDRHLPLGEKRNLSHTLCSGDIIVYLDDDDYYPPTRVAHAVERLLGSEALIAGSTILPILFLPERELWVAGPYGSQHATAGTFAFKRQMLEQSRYDDDKSFAEEKSFLRDYTLPMVQLDSSSTILCIAHDRNTFEKRRLIAQGRNPRFRKVDQAGTERLLQQLKDLLPHYENLLASASGSVPQPPAAVAVAAASASVPSGQSTGGIRFARLAPPGETPVEALISLAQVVASAAESVEEVNLCVVSRPNDPFSLCFLDVARYLRYRLRLIQGIRQVHLSRNRLYKDAVNIVLGAHMGFEPENCRRYRCIFVNLEQLGQLRKRVRSEYLELLSQAAVVDYDPSNLEYYRRGAHDRVAIFSFGYAPYLQAGPAALPPPKPLRDRPIDLLFYGSMNDSRRRLLQRLARHGGDVKILDGLFGPERDAVIRDAKLVVNLAYYEKGTFEQVRAFHCLSLGTPMLSIKSDNTSNIPAGFREAVFFMALEEACDFLENVFRRDGFYAEAQSKLASFRESPHENLESEQQQLRQLLAAAGGRPVDGAGREKLRINLGSGHQYMPGWINIDVDTSTYPDIVMDLGDEIVLPILARSPYAGAITIDENSVHEILADNVLEHVSDLPRLMTNCLRILAVGGQMTIVVPHERSLAAWQDPTHVRAFNERSWIYYTDWCWRLGWFHARFSMTSFSYLDANAKALSDGSEQAFFMKVVMTKVQATPKEKNRYRLLRSDFGPGIDD